jgi:Holliday junction DNA helicase RuvA
MIGKLTGLVDESEEGRVLIDVSGVGYVVHASTRTLSRLPGKGEAASLLIETHVREDHIHLYGFIDQAELEWFRLLGTVQGVGARMALAILSAIPPEQLIQAIAAQDKGALTRANGVGPKLASRIVSELKEKAGSIAIGPIAVVTGGKAESPPDGGVSEDAVSALVNLGYRRVEAFGAVARASGQLGQQASLESLIKVGLKELGS